MLLRLWLRTVQPSPRRFAQKVATIVYVRVDLNNFLRLPTDLPLGVPDNTPAIASEIVPESGDTGDRSHHHEAALGRLLGNRP